MNPQRHRTNEPATTRAGEPARPAPNAAKRARSNDRERARPNEPPDRWGSIETPFATFAAWADAHGRLTRFNLSAHGAAAVDPAAVHDERAIETVRAQVLEYCSGRRTTFEIERAARGTEFQHAVWNALVEIPYGETRSYGEIAAAIGRPGASRAVGAANGQNPIALIVPCHRVIGANGTLTGYGGGLPLKQALLAHEARVAGRTFELSA
jgi:methylated-DNA-[protein]-cysteine S-methyltransferase